MRVPAGDGCGARRPCARTSSRKRMRPGKLGDRKEATMAGVETIDFDSPDETRTPEKTRVDVVRSGGTKAPGMPLKHGWVWSDCVKPVARTDTCQLRHVGVVGSGRL